MTYRAPLAGLLMGAAVTYLRICVLGGACNERVIFIHALNNLMDMLGTQPFVLCIVVLFRRFRRLLYYYTESELVFCRQSELGFTVPGTLYKYNLHLGLL